MIVKLIVSFLEIQMAKTLNDEPRIPVTMSSDMFDMSKSQPAQYYYQHPLPTPMTRPVSGGGAGPTTSPTSTKSTTLNETLPPYHSAASAGRADDIYVDKYPTMLSKTTTTTTTIQKYDDNIVTTNADDL